MKNRIDTDEMEVTWEWDSFKTNEVQQLIDQWISEYEIFDSESLFQLDNGLIESPTLVAQILDVLGIEVEWKE